MRTTFLTLFLIISSFSILAQDETSFKPSGGDWNAEVNFMPFSSSPIEITYVRLRNFMSSREAVRLGVSMTGRFENPEEDIKLSTFTINLRPGLEKHFEGTERISPYIGGELDLAVKTSKFLDETGTEDFEISGAWNDVGQERGFFRFGMNFIVGVDCYIVKRLYLGTEFGFGFEFINVSDIEFDPDPGDSTIEGGSTFQFGPNFNSAIRLGYFF